MFEKFTEKAIRVVCLAQEEARRQMQQSTGIECLLLGLLVEESGLAAKALKECGLAATDLRTVIKERFKPCDGPTPAEIPFSQHATTVFSKACEGIYPRHSNEVDTEHLLLAMLDIESGATILSRCNCDNQKLREVIVTKLEKNIAASRNTPPITFSKGDVVLVLFQGAQDGFEREKRRPAVIIASDDSLQQLTNVPIVPLVSNPKKKARPKYEIEIQYDSTAGKLAGLRTDCVAPCNLLCFYPKEWFVQKIGRLPHETVNAICKQVGELIGLD